MTRPYNHAAVRLLDPSDRLDRLFVGFLAGMAVVVGILAWQAIESQEVKGSLKGGFGHVSVDPLGEGPGGFAAQYVNEGDRTLTLEGAELIEPTGNVEVLEIVAREPGALEPEELEGFEVAPGEAVEIVALLRISDAGAASFEGLRLHYRAGGRAGQTAG
jgi:hypothetical protein